MVWSMWSDTKTVRRASLSRSRATGCFWRWIALLPTITIKTTAFEIGTCQICPSSASPWYGICCQEILKKQGENVFAFCLYSCREVCGKSMGKVCQPEDGKIESGVQLSPCNCSGGQGVPQLVVIRKMRAVPSTLQLNVYLAWVAFHLS